MFEVYAQSQALHLFTCSVSLCQCSHELETCSLRKYVFSGLLLALPVPFWRHLLRFFDGVKQATKAKSLDVASEARLKDPDRQADRGKNGF